MSDTVADDNSSDYEETAIDDLLHRPVAFHRSFLKFGAGITGALMLSQAYYWSSRTRDAGRWFYKSREEWEEETGLSRYEQEGARKSLIKTGVLEEEKRGIPCKLYYRVNRRLVMAVLLGEIPPASRRDNHKLAGIRPNSKSGEKPPAITETTAETSPETTTDIFATDADASVGAVGAPLVGELLPDQRATSRKGLTVVTKPPMVIEAGEKRIEIPGELKYPGPTTKSHKTWINYAVRYQRRYQAWPLWNETIAGMLTHFIKRVGAEAAPKVAAFYLGVNDAFIVKSGHSIKQLLSNAESFHTQWATNTSMTSTKAAQIDKTQTNFDAAGDAETLIRARHAARAANANANG